MPELPEIETIKLQLQKVLVGLEIDYIEQLHPKSLQGDATLISGKKITQIRRFGKMLVIDLSDKLHLAIHFKMSGQLILVKNLESKVKSVRDDIHKRIAGGHPSGDWIGKLPSKHTRAIFHFKSGDALYFNDQRIFGWVKISNTKELENMPFIQKLGKEPWDLSDDEFHELFVRRKKAVKHVLMDQELLSGVGNIYANDALWEAKIHPERQSQSLDKKETSVLRKCIIKVLKEGIKYGGATASDEKYMNLDGLGGHYQDHFRVYDREGKKCLRNDKGVVKKIVLGARGTYFCLVCQRLNSTILKHPKPGGNEQVGKLHR
jgi:formamidopyrimidine-DNA glycosylase